MCVAVVVLHIRSGRLPISWKRAATSTTIGGHRSAVMPGGRERVLCCCASCERAGGGGGGSPPVTLSTCQLNRATIRVQYHMYRESAEFLHPRQSLSLRAASLID